MNFTFGKIYRICISIVLAFIMILLINKMLLYFNYNKVNWIKEFNDPKTLYGDELCYSNKDYLYTVNPKLGMVHIFNKNGRFEKGYLIPTNGGNVWSGMSDKLYIYSIRKQLLCELSGANQMITIESNYGSLEDFYTAVGITQDDSLNIKRNVVTLSVGNVNSQIELDIKYSFISFEICVLLFGICFFMFAFVTGLFGKLKDDISSI